MKTNYFLFRAVAILSLIIIMSCKSNNSVVEIVQIPEMAVSETYYEEQYQRWKALFKEKQYDEAMNCLKNSAEGNYIEAFGDLAYHFSEGTVYPHDFELAERYARRGADQGDMYSQLRLGRILREKGKKQEALEWMRKSAEQGQGWAAFMVGEMYENGEGAKASVQQAIRWYRESAKRTLYYTKDHARKALKRLGATIYEDDEYMELVEQYMLPTGETAEELYKEGQLWEYEYEPRQLACLIMSADKNYPKAQKELASIYKSSDARLYGIYDASKSDSLLVKAYDGFVKQMKSGDVDAMYEIGHMYNTGTGFLKKNLRNAEHCFKDGAEKGHSGCQLHLGIILRNAGQKEEAFRWLVKSGMQNQGWAAYLVGEMYENGEGVKQDLGRAIEWYTKSAKTTNFYAEDAREALKRLGEPVPYNSFFDD